MPMVQAATRDIETHKTEFKKRIDEFNAAVRLLQSPPPPPLRPPCAGRPNHESARAGAEAGVVGGRADGGAGEEAPEGDERPRQRGKPVPSTHPPPDPPRAYADGAVLCSKYNDMLKERLDAEEDLRRQAGDGIKKGGNIIRRR